MNEHYMEVQNIDANLDIFSASPFLEQFMRKLRLEQFVESMENTWAEWVSLHWITKEAKQLLAMIEPTVLRLHA